MQLKMFFSVPSVCPCIHHNYGVISGRRARRDCVWHGRNLVGDTGDVSPHSFRRGDIICHVPPIFSLSVLYLERA